MSRRKDMLRDKLNALKPSIPTNTRPVKETGADAPPAARRARPAKKKPQAAQAGSKVKTMDENPPAAANQPELNRAPNEAGDAPKTYTFDYIFIYSDLMKENLDSFNRMRDTMVSEANNINNIYIKSCWKSVEIGFEAFRKVCSLFTPFRPGKWPFQF